MLKTVEILVLIFVFSSCAAHKRFAREGAEGPPAYTGMGERLVTGGLQPGRVFQEGMASYYANEFNGRKTANGEVYNMHDMTAAHQTLPFNTKVRVENLENGRSVVVRINDRGPFAKGRIIDLSLSAGRAIGLTGQGTAKVRLVIEE